MSAIATVLHDMGHEVSGSDLKDSPVAERLRSKGIAVALGHRPENVGRAEVVTFSPAVATDNVELVEAAARDVLVVPRSQMLAAICATRQCLAVAGTHGKTTTASMLSLILVEAGLRPSFVIGADVNEIGTNAVWDTGEWLVVEADESYGTFGAIRTRSGRAHERRGGPPRLLRHVRVVAGRIRRFRGLVQPGLGGVQRRRDRSGDRGRPWGHERR